MTELIVDCSRAGAGTKISGIPRVLGEVISHSSDQVITARFSPDKKSFVTVDSEELSRRPEYSVGSSKELSTRDFLLLPALVHRFIGAISAVQRSLRLSKSRLDVDKVRPRAKVRKQPIDFALSGTLIVLDVPHSRRHVNAIRGWARTPGNRVTIYLHDLFPISHPELFRWQPSGVWKRRALVQLLSLGTEETVGFAGNSAFTVGQIQRHLSGMVAVRRAIPYIPPFVGSQLRKNRKSKSCNQAIEGGQAARVRILGVGALNSRKNFAVVIRAHEILVQHGVESELTLVTTQNATTSWAAQRSLKNLSLEARARLHLKIGVPDVELEELYIQSTVVAVPSVAEGFGLPVLEAWCHGTPIVASERTALVEFAGRFPVTIVDPYNPEEWAKAFQNTASFCPLALPAEFPATWGNFVDRLEAVGDENE